MAVVVVLMVLVGLVTVRWTIHRSFAQMNGTITLSGLDGPVTVIRDGWGIPQIYASTADDLFFAQGFVQAQDRFFEMDFRRHVTSGTLTEMFGRDALKTDEFVRTMGWRRVATKELGLMKPQTRTYLEAYAHGVNAYLAGRSGSTLSLEYTVLGLGGLDYTPKPWTPVDSLSWLKAMAWSLQSNTSDEIERAIDSQTLTTRQIGQLFPAYPYAQHPVIVRQGGVVDGVYEQNATGNGTRLPNRVRYPEPVIAQLKSIQQIQRRIPGLLGTGSGLGSNAWAVSGRMTTTGKPILANDPHLAPSMPGIWYQMGLHCTTVDAACPFDVAGFTFSGVPGVVIGHNRRIAWGFTNLETDTADLYLEKVSSNDTYLYAGRQLPLTTRTETFDIMGAADPVRITVRTTRDGPIMSDVSPTFAHAGREAPVRKDATAGIRSPARGNGYAVAVRWAALTPGNTADAVFEFDRAADWSEFRNAARDFQTPSQNLVYADVDGHIGYQAPGMIPIRRTGDGRWPVPGWDPAYDWTGYIPFDALPDVLDPREGFVSTANQPVVGTSYPYFIGSSADYGYRSTRIRTLLQSSGALDVAKTTRIQLDTFNAIGQVLTPYLLSIKLSSHYDRAIQHVLRSWDFDQPASSAGALAFNVVWRQLLAKTFHDQLPRVTWPDGGDRWFEVMERLIREPNSRWWDDVTTPGVRETRDQILEVALTNARDELTRTVSLDPSRWHWGSVHTLLLRNPTLGADSSPVRFLFNRGPFGVPGGPSIVDATSWNARHGYQATAVPSMRMVVSLADLDNSVWVNLTGASGHAYDRHYDDQTALWLDGRYLPWVFTRSAVERNAAAILTLRPR